MIDSDYHLILTPSPISGSSADDDYDNDDDVQ